MTQLKAPQTFAEREREREPENLRDDGDDDDDREAVGGKRAGGEKGTTGQGL